MKKTLFRGFKPVFAFTAKQNLKTKGFLATTIIVALIMFAIPFAANVYMGVSAKNEAAENASGETSEDEGSSTEVTEESDIHNIYFVNNTDVMDAVIQGAIASYGNETGASITVKMAWDENEDAILKHAGKTLETSQVIFAMNEVDGKYVIKAYVLDGNKDMKNQVSELSTSLTQGIPNLSYAMSGLDVDTIVNIASGSHSTVIKAGEQADDIGVILVKTLLPMLVGLLLYMLINMSAQSVTKVVIAEKTSKLMETLLTSAMPYGIIAGKVLAVTVMAIGQMMFWLLSLVIGFVAGNFAADAICPGYNNIIIMVIDMIKDSAAGAFGVGTVILGIVMLMLGFLFYCVYAGFVGTFVQKAEDLGNSQVFLVIPWMISWLVAYMAPAIENEALLGFVRVFPLTSPFSVPADVIVGNVNIVMALISMVLLLVVTVVMILATGYMYKKRVFR